MTNGAPPRPPASWVGRRVQVEVGPVAHGGHFVARYEGRVVFVRHALPGELVLVEITEDAGKAFCRGDAVEVLSAAAGRVPPPCRYAHPGGCGGCDFQHVRPEEQRRLKAAVVAEQFRRLAGLELSPVVEPLEPDALGWRRRIRYAVTPDGSLGLHAHRSHRVIDIDRCLIGAPGVGDSPALSDRWPASAEVEVAADDHGQTAIVVRRGEGGGAPAARRRGRHRPAAVTADVVAGPAVLRFDAAGRGFRVSAGGFWQTHPAAADAFLGAVLTGTAPRPGDRALDLYAGAGLFTAVLGQAVGPAGRVRGLEGDRRAGADAAANLSRLPWATVEHAAISADTVRAAVADLGRLDVAVLDPPRSGAGAAVMTALIAAAPSAIGYVACDPAALARDVASARGLGWHLDSLRAFDAFPMTHHVECVAILRPGAR